MIGIISDTHDNLDAIRKMVEFLNRQQVGLVIHAGDFIAPFTIREFSKLNMPLKGVFGNNDGEREGLTKKFSEIGTELQDVLEFEYDGKKICVYHGTAGEKLDELINSKKFDLVITGHTHGVRVEEVDNTLVVNPGEVCGYLTGRKTACILNTKL